MPKIGGLEYSYAELTRMSGMPRASLWERYHKNPHITLAELISPTRKRTTRYAIVRGKEISLYSWAKRNNANYSIVSSRWNNGIRDPRLLVKGLKNTAVDPSKLPLPPIPDDMIEWLELTAFARKGQPDEWEIACELIGIAPYYAEALREFMEGRNDTKG